MFLQLSAANPKGTKWQRDTHQPTCYDRCSGLCQSQSINKIWTLEILSPGMDSRCWVPSDVTTLQPHPAIQGGSGSVGAQFLPPRLGLSDFSSQYFCGFWAFQNIAANLVGREGNAKTIDRDSWAERRREYGNSEKQVWHWMHISKDVAPLLDLTDAEVRSQMKWLAQGHRVS